MNRCGTMKLLLRCLLLSSLCNLSSWSVSSDVLVVTQSPDVSYQEGQIGNISCCWRGKPQRVGIQWLKNQTAIKNKTFIDQSTGSQSEQMNTCSFLTFPKITSRDSGRYICKVNVEIPVLNEVNGTGTTITVTARETPDNSTAAPYNPPNNPAAQQFPLIIAGGVLVPVFLIALICFCSLREEKGQAARVIYEVPHTDSIEAEMDKHSTSSSRGSTQWCEVPMYDSLNYFEHVQPDQKKL